MLRRAISSLISLAVVLAIASLVGMVALSSLSRSFESSKPREADLPKHLDVECRKLLDRGYVCVLKASRDLGTVELYLANGSRLKISIPRGIHVEIFRDKPLFLIVRGEVVRIDYG